MIGQAPRFLTLLICMLAMNVALVEASNGPSFPPSSSCGAGSGGGGDGGSGGTGGGTGGGGNGHGDRPGRDDISRSNPQAVALAREGPRLPLVYAFASLSFEAVLKGGWPVVAVYDVAPGAFVELEFNTDRTVTRFRLSAPPATSKVRQRQLLKVELPASFGKVLTVGTVSVRVSGKGDGSLPVVRLYGLGAGPLAVGSVSIDEVVFEPERLQLATGERAYYSFHSKSDFNKASIDIARLDGRDGSARLVLVRSETVQQSVARNTWVGRQPPLYWNGLNQAGKASSGAHLLYVRAWATDPGDWVIAWSPRAVEVQP
ncbi:hypothetical protein [Pseudomonas akapageensis]|uniref:hypothetical protein n=1 Tax=Pseudomonas akapageensis TaxID=2609961 RepID=UPI0014083879|nr:hypothetical protein [Pseudomonas akapageensis]